MLLGCICRGEHASMCVYISVERGDNLHPKYPSAPSGTVSQLQRELFKTGPVSVQRLCRSWLGVSTTVTTIGHEEGSTAGVGDKPRGSPRLGSDAHLKRSKARRFLPGGALQGGHGARWTCRLVGPGCSCQAFKRC